MTDIVEKLINTLKKRRHAIHRRDAYKEAFVEAVQQNSLAAISGIFEAGTLRTNSGLTEILYSDIEEALALALKHGKMDCVNWLFFNRCGEHVVDSARAVRTILQEAASTELELRHCVDIVTYLLKKGSAYIIFPLQLRLTIFSAAKYLTREAGREKVEKIFMLLLDVPGVGMPGEDLIGLRRLKMKRLTALAVGVRQFGLHAPWIIKNICKYDAMWA